MFPGKRFTLDRRPQNWNHWLYEVGPSTGDMSVEPNSDLQLEIGYLLLIDVVGYSKLLVNEQIELLQGLNRIVRSTPSFRIAEENGKLIRLPTGDGMALVFFR